MKESLVDQEYIHWPQISPVKKLDLVKMSIKEGPWAMALQPLEFAKKYQLFNCHYIIIIIKSYSK